MIYVILDTVSILALSAGIMILTYWLRRQSREIIALSERVMMLEVKEFQHLNRSKKKPTTAAELANMSNEDFAAWLIRNDVDGNHPSIRSADERAAMTRLSRWNAFE